MTELTTKPIDINIPRELSPLHDKAGEILEELQDVNKFINDLNQEIVRTSKGGDYQASIFVENKKDIPFHVNEMKAIGLHDKVVELCEKIVEIYKANGYQADYNIFIRYLIKVSWEPVVEYPTKEESLLYKLLKFWK